MSDRRADLQKKCLDYVLEHGVAGLSLRPLAAAAGTSARLLVYHFGSRDGLVTAVMDDVRARFQASLRAGLRPRRRGEHPMLAFWASLTRPPNRPYLRLLFEVQALALQDPKRYAQYVQRTSASWLALLEEALPPSPSRRERATLCIAVVDGLLLELLSTGDLRRTTGALRLFVGEIA